MFVRKDLTPSQIAVQSCHAAIEAARNGLIPSDIEHPHLVLIGCQNLPALLKVRSKLRTLKIHHKDFIEPDIGNQVTAIATAPLSGDSRKHFKQYTLLNFGQHVSSPSMVDGNSNPFDRRDTMDSVCN